MSAAARIMGIRREGEDASIYRLRLPGGPARFDVLRTEVDAVNPRTATAEISRFVDHGVKTYVVFCTVSSVLSARDVPGVQDALDEAGLVTPDGMPLVWLGRRSCGPTVERVYGPDFISHLIGATGSRFRHFFYGGPPGAAAETALRLKRRFPDLTVAGTLSPPAGLSGTELCADDVKSINAARPDIVWVGLGHPKQELWMKTHRDALEAPVLTGVGAAFDFLSGRKKEAPGWMKRSGLQWLHRLADEPSRLWRRYLVGNPRFLILLARERLGLGGR